MTKNMSPPTTFIFKNNSLFKLLSFPNKIFTRSQIMNDCWGMYSDSIDRTIDVHITHIREKLSHIEDFSIVTVRGLGYKAVINNASK